MLISLEMHMLVIKTIDMFTEVTPSHNDHHMSEDTPTFERGVTSTDQSFILKYPDM